MIYPDSIRVNSKIYEIMRKIGQNTPFWQASFVTALVSCICHENEAQLITNLALAIIFRYHIVSNEPVHEKMCPMSYANNKGADQPAHPRSLISAFVIRCLDRIISLDSIAEISRH